MHSLLFLQSDQNPVFCWYFHWEQQQVVCQVNWPRSNKGRVCQKLKWIFFFFSFGDNWISNTQSYWNFMERKKIHPVPKKYIYKKKQYFSTWERHTLPGWEAPVDLSLILALVATLSFHWVEFFPLVKPRNGWVDYKLSPQPPLTQGWVIGWHGKWVTIQFWMNYPFYKTTIISTKLLRILLII